MLHIGFIYFYSTYIKLPKLRFSPRYTNTNVMQICQGVHEYRSEAHQNMSMRRNYHQRSATGDPTPLETPTAIPHRRPNPTGNPNCYTSPETQSHRKPQLLPHRRPTHFQRRSQGFYMRTQLKYFKNGENVFCTFWYKKNIYIIAL